MGFFDKDEGKTEVKPFEKVTAEKPTETPKPKAEPKPKKEKAQKKAGSRAEALREQAKKLMERAKQEDEAVATKIGKVVLKMADKDFAGFNLESFKAEVSEIRGA